MKNLLFILFAILICIAISSCEDDPESIIFTSYKYDAHGGGQNDAGTATVITNNVFYNNQRPLSISTEFNIDNFNTFHNPSNASEVNLYNGIFVETINEITQPTSWSETEVAFVIDDNDWWINTGASLSLANDVVLKFKSSSVFLLTDGLSNLVNYNGSGVVFTSYNDDSYKGDTNGDGSITTPTSGDWEGIYDDSMAIPAPYFYSWSNIYYDNY